MNFSDSRILNTFHDFKHHYLLILDNVKKNSEVKLNVVSTSPVCSSFHRTRPPALSKSSTSLQVECTATVC